MLKFFLLTLTLTLGIASLSCQTYTTGLEQGLARGNEAGVDAQHQHQHAAQRLVAGLLLFRHGAQLQPVLELGRVVALPPLVVAAPAWSATSAASRA